MAKLVAVITRNQNVPGIAEYDEVFGIDRRVEPFIFFLAHVHRGVNRVATDKFVSAEARVSPSWLGMQRVKISRIHWGSRFPLRYVKDRGPIIKNSESYRGVKLLKVERH